MKTELCKKRTLRRYSHPHHTSHRTQQPNYQIDIIGSNTKSTIERVLKNLHKIYKNIIKNQIAPKTNYLLQSIKTRSNLDKTIEKLDIMKKLNAI